MPKSTRKDIQDRVRRYRQEYARLKARIRGLGFICEGSLVERWMPCGKSACRCAADPAQWHGPYYQLSWKEKGKTVSRHLSPEHAKLYKEWITNRRQLDSILKRMRTVSNKAGRHLLDAATESSRAKPGARAPRSRPRRKR